MEKTQKFSAVIDTNVLVSALWSKDRTSPVVAVINAVNARKIVPIIHSKIIFEYKEVLSRPKFNFDKDKVKIITDRFESLGIYYEELHSDEIFPDETDRIFYEVTLNARNDFDAELVTGNAKHFPAKPFVVSAREMMEIVENG